LLVEAVDELEPVALLAEEPEFMRSEKRLTEPRAEPRLLAGELLDVEPEVSDEEDVLVAVLVEAIVVVEAVTALEAADTLEAFELELREDIRFPL